MIFDEYLLLDCHYGILTHGRADIPSLMLLSHRGEFCFEKVVMLRRPRMCSGGSEKVILSLIRRVMSLAGV